MIKSIFYILVSIILLVTSCHHKNEQRQTATIMTKKDTTGFNAGYSDVNGIKMYYEIHGSGEPLVLIHGGGSTIETNFGRIIPLLASHFKIIALELQEHGHTSGRDKPESFEQDADDVAYLLKNLGIGNANLFGFSNGGNTAMQVAIRHPQIVNKLVLASTFYKREGMVPGFFDFMQHASLENMPKPLQTAFLKINPDSNRLQAMHDKDRDRMLAFKDWTDESIRSIKGPSLILIGDKDVVLPEHAVAMSRLLPNARLMILPGGHGSFIGEICSPVPDDKTLQSVTTLITDFLVEK